MKRYVHISLMLVCLFGQVDSYPADYLPTDRLTADRSTVNRLTAGTADSLKVVDVEEVLVIAAPKENRKLREQAAAVSLLPQEAMQAAQIRTVKNLTGVVPNLFIPDYGSRLTSSIYIRGIGSRINTPSVGLYVDNIPCLDKSAFDFSYADVERIDVLRGPQGTLYGRCVMGGLIKVHTKSPFSYQGTDLRMGAGTRNAYNASLTHYHRISERFAFSAGGFYDYEGGFFRNETLRQKADKGQASGGRIRAILLPAANWKLDLNVNYEYSDQDAYPYCDTSTGTIDNNEQATYRRSLLNAGINIEHQARHFTLSAVTGYQFLKDRMFMDQDFTAADIFNLEQKQRTHTLSEEIILKSKPAQRWQWTSGVFGFYQWQHTDGPVTFHREGIGSLIEDNVNEVFEGLAAKGAPAMHLGIQNESLRIGGSFDTPTLNGALFHQSTFNDLLVAGLSVTLGLRLDYEKLRMDYNSASTPTLFDFTLQMTSPRPMTMESKDLTANSAYAGKLSTDYVQLLPKFALQYEWQRGSNAYLTIARGYRSGGYNFQMFSDLASGTLRNSMMDALAADPKFSSMAAMIDGMKTVMPSVEEATRYKPEYTWNYEAGTHLNLLDGHLQADLSAFYMDTRNQQIARFSPSGLGRITVNAGKSHSYGVEASLTAVPTEALTLNANYGYTRATFTDHVIREATATETELNYNGNYVPFAPRHTLSLGGQYTIRFRHRQLLDRILLNANYAAAGRIYWTEANNASQSFYGTLNLRLSLQKGNGQIDLWVRNALNKHYAAFFFESMGNSFVQKGRPVQAGIQLRCRF